MLQMMRLVAKVILGSGSSPLPEKLGRLLS